MKIADVSERYGISTDTLRYYSLVKPVGRDVISHDQAGAIKPVGRDIISPYFVSILLMAYSANAVIVRLGFTPGLAGIIEPSTMYKPG